MDGIALRRELSLQRDIMTVPHGLIEALLATASDAIIATDHAGITNFWNPGAIRIFGFTADEAIGRSLDLIIPDNLRARHWTGFNRVMGDGSKSLRPRRPAVSAGADQRRTTRLSRIHDRYVEGRAKTSDRDSGNSSRCHRAL